MAVPTEIACFRREPARPLRNSCSSGTIRSRSCTTQRL